MKAVLHRMTFVLLSTITMVFFSEKVFWYVQGYAMVELVVYYFFPVFICIWALETYRVQSLAPLILIAAMFGFLVEGVLTPVLYESGLLDPVMPAYFVGWHGLLSVIFGWYLLHRWLVEGRWRLLLIAGIGMGLFWGLWSLPYWLPESIAEFEALVAQGEPVRPGAWPTLEYLRYTLIFSLILIAAHWLLGRLWLAKFRPSKWEKGLISLAMLGLFCLIVVPVIPAGFLKLGVLLGLILLGLSVAKRQATEGSLLTDLSGRIRLTHSLALLSMPIVASSVYAMARLIQPSDEVLRAFYQITAPSQAMIGAVAFIWALFKAVRTPKLPGDDRRMITRGGSHSGLTPPRFQR